MLPLLPHRVCAPARLTFVVSFAALAALLASCSGDSSSDPLVETPPERILVVEKFGSGTMSSSPGGIQMSTGLTVAAFAFSHGTQVSLSANPSPGWRVAGWGGICAANGQSPSCSFAMTQDRTISVTFEEEPNPEFTLSVSKGGSGTVTSNPSGISISGSGSSASASFSAGTSVVLTAAAADGWTLEGWGGACSGSSNTCTVAMTQNRTVTVAFKEEAASAPLPFGTPQTGLSGAVGTERHWVATVPGVSSVQLPSGVVASAVAMGGGVDRDGAFHGEAVRILVPEMADQTAGRTLRIKMSGGTGDADLYVRRGAAPTANQYDCRPYLIGNDEECVFENPASGEWFIMIHAFEAYSGVQLVATLESNVVEHTLSVTKTGSGTVVSNPSGIHVQASQSSGSAAFEEGTTVTLTATPSSGWEVANWGGACSGSTNTCTVTMSQDRSASVTFQEEGQATALTLGTPVTNLSGAVNSERLFVVTIPESSQSRTLRVTLSGGSGDADLYVRRGAEPTLTQYDCRPFLIGNNEVCAFHNPAAGQWYIMLHGFEAYSGVQIVATLEAGGTSTHTLSANKSGSGTLSSSPSGLSLGTSQTSGSAEFPSGTSVTLTATPSSGWVVSGWGGACAGSGGTGTGPQLCHVSMTQDRSVSVTFQQQTSAGFNIQLVYDNPVSSTVSQAFNAAANRWAGLMTSKLTPIPLTVPEGACERTADTPLTVDDILIFVVVEPIDGPFGTLAQAGPCYTRISGGTTIVGVIIFDEDDIGRLVQSGQLQAVILHEMGHVLGFGTLWEGRGLLQNPSLPNSPGVDTHFTGPQAITAFNAVGGSGYTGGAKVPVENTEGGEGTRDGHWRLSVFGSELMVGFLQSSSPMSRVTIASLGDLGYSVNQGAADNYTLAAAILARVAPGREGIHMVNDIFRTPVGEVNDNGEVVRWVQPDGGATGPVRRE